MEATIQKTSVTNSQSAQHGNNAARPYQNQQPNIIQQQDREPIPSQRIGAHPNRPAGPQSQTVSATPPKEPVQRTSPAAILSEKPWSPSQPLATPNSQSQDTSLGKEKKQPNMKARKSDWTRDHYESFTQFFNAAENLRIVKDWIGEQRRENIKSICTDCLLQGFPIDQEKMRVWFIEGENGRFRSPIAKVSNGDYIRISDTLTKRWGLILVEGQLYKVEGKKNSAGLQVITLTQIE